jgi:hypothetical protein
MGTHQIATSGTDTWLTPRWLLGALGPFDLDPCAAPEPRPWPTAARHVSRPGDGLSVRWAGRVWLNPPYSNIGTWMGRLAAHGQGTALVFARTETVWFTSHVWRRANALLFLERRLSFCLSDGRESTENAGAPSVLIAYGLDDKERLRSCGIPGAFIPGWQMPEAVPEQEGLW